MKIPPKATKVFSGTIFDVYQWEETLYDGTKGLFEGLKRMDTVQIIPVSGDTIYLSYEEQPAKPWSIGLFGGRCEEGEDTLITAQRELKEEAGMEADIWKLYRTFSFKGKIEWNVHLYIAQGCRKVADQHLDAGEHIEIREVTFDQFIDIVTDESFCSDTIAAHVLRLQKDPMALEAFRQEVLYGS